MQCVSMLVYACVWVCVSKVFTLIKVWRFDRWLTDISECLVIDEKKNYHYRLLIQKCRCKSLLFNVTCDHCFFFLTSDDFFERAYALLHVGVMPLCVGLFTRLKWGQFHVCLWGGKSVTSLLWKSIFFYFVYWVSPNP